MLDEATARASAIHDGAERRLNLLTSRHTETMRRLTEIRDVVTNLVASEASRGSLEDEVAKSVANSFAAGGPRRHRCPAGRRGRGPAWRPATGQAAGARSPATAPRPRQGRRPSRQPARPPAAARPAPRWQGPTTRGRRGGPARPGLPPGNAASAEAASGRPAAERPGTAGNEGEPPRCLDEPARAAPPGGRRTCWGDQGPRSGGQRVDPAQDHALTQRPGADFELAQAEQVHGRVGHHRARGELRRAATGDAG